MLKKTLSTTALLAALAISSISMSHTASAQEATSANARWLAGEFQRRHSEGADLAVQIAQIQARSEYPSMLVNDMMGREQMTMEDRDQFLDAVQPYFDTAHRQASDELKSIVSRIGWDGISAAGEYLMVQAFDVVLQSPDLTFQRAAIPAFEPLAERDFINSYMFALFYDDVMVASGEQQRWGTVGECVDGSWQIAPTEDRANLDTRRETVGMVPLQEFIDGEIELYGGCSAS